MRLSTITWRLPTDNPHEMVPHIISEYLRMLDPEEFLIHAVDLQTSTQSQASFLYMNRCYYQKPRKDFKPS